MKFTSALLALLSTAVQSVPSTTWEKGNMNEGVILTGEVDGHRVIVNKGLTGWQIAAKGFEVPFMDGTNSTDSLHRRNDGGGIFAKDDGSGYYYASNSENGSLPNSKIGGVWTFELNNDMKVTDYYQSLGETADNCAGGKTPWGTWVSCEEESGNSPAERGRCWQVDPAFKGYGLPGCLGPIDDYTASYDKNNLCPQVTYVTAYNSNWEGFAWDEDDHRGYTTDDDDPEEGKEWQGALDRFTPDADAMECLLGTTKGDKWCALNSGSHDFLKLNPKPGNPQFTEHGTFEWVVDEDAATPNDSALPSNPELYPKGEGIHVEDGILTFVAKDPKKIFYLDLATQKYTSELTTSCLQENVLGQPASEDCVFQQPDNIRGLGRDMYINTDGPDPNRVMAIDTINKCYSIIIQDYSEFDADGNLEIDHGAETAGVDFTPDGKYMITSFQDEAVWVFAREDGESFADYTGKTVCERPEKLP